jgi:hypothetical protein
MLPPPSVPIPRRVHPPQRRRGTANPTTLDDHDLGRALPSNLPAFSRNPADLDMYALSHKRRENRTSKDTTQGSTDGEALSLGDVHRFVTRATSHPRRSISGRKTKGKSIAGVRGATWGAIRPRARQLGGGSPDGNTGLGDEGRPRCAYIAVYEKGAEGTSALSAATSGATAPDKTIAELKHRDFETISTDLPEELEILLREAFSQAE